MLFKKFSNLDRQSKGNLNEFETLTNDTEILNNLQNQTSIKIDHDTCKKRVCVKKSDKYPTQTRTSGISEYLPVWEKKSEIIQSIQNNTVTLIVGETGSGKTTQLPQMLLEHFCQSKIMLGAPYTCSTIAITQPRRIAAISLANRVSQEIREYARSRGFDHILERDLNNDESIQDEKTNIYDIGGVVGYSVRFQSKTSKRTRIKFVTDGIILREALINPLLSHYRIIIIDEAHERSVQTDTFLSFLKLLLERRKNLHIVIMSATLDYRSFTSFFGQGNVLMIPGRQYPVNIYQMCSSTNDPLDVILF
jgi:HrpA-like RNA helicase